MTLSFESTLVAGPSEISTPFSSTHEMLSRLDAEKLTILSESSFEKRLR